MEGTGPPRPPVAGPFRPIAPVELTHVKAARHASAKVALFQVRGERRMGTQSHWRDWVATVVGVWIMFSPLTIPFLFGQGDAASIAVTLNHFVVGAVVAGLGWGCLERAQGLGGIRWRGVGPVARRLTLGAGLPGRTSVDLERYDRGHRGRDCLGLGALRAHEPDARRMSVSGRVIQRRPG